MRAWSAPWEKLSIGILALQIFDYLQTHWRSEWSADRIALHLLSDWVD
jgi:hypothetical protein